MVCYHVSVSVSFLTFDLDKFFIEQAVVNGNKLFSVDLYSPVVMGGSLATVNIENNVHANKLKTGLQHKRTGVGVSHAVLLYSTCQV